jgi:uncharacterized membrane protein
VFPSLIAGTFVVTAKPLAPFPFAKLMRLIAIALLIVAISFRFTHLDRKVYWHDEAYTSLAITARPGKYFNDHLFQNRVVKAADLLAYQRFVPDLTLLDMLVRKGTEDVQHPPIYYLLLRVWTQIWGTTPTVTRGFSALLSLLMFPALYWLCLELFESRLSGWVAIALFAVSPFHLVYAQEAREFGVWTVLTVVSSAFLLRANRSSSWQNWLGYGVCMVVSCYTSLFSWCVAIGHLAFILLIDSGNCFAKLPMRIGKRTIFCFITLVGVAFLFIPWMYFVVISREMLHKTTAWTAISAPWMIQLQSTVFNFSRSFVDFNLELNDGVAYALAIPILALQGYAMGVLGRTAPKTAQLFIFTLVGSTVLILGLPDLLWGGQRFTVPRYPIPCYVGLHLAVVYLFSTYFAKPQRWKARFATIVFCLLISLGIFSCGVHSQSNTWWNKQLSSNYRQLADLINRSDRPLILVESWSYYPVSTISLSYLLKPDTPFLLLPPVGESFPIPAVPEGVQTIFLFNLSEAFRQQFEFWSQKSLTLAFQDPWNQVWRTNSDPKQRR